jgi:hypothetical protein
MLSSTVGTFDDHVVELGDRATGSGEKVHQPKLPGPPLNGPTTSAVTQPP